jgi:hypothetical protein
MVTICSQSKHTDVQYVHCRRILLHSLACRHIYSP